MPDKVKFGINTTNIDGRAYRTFTVTDYPLEVANAWLYPLFQLDNCRVVVNGAGSAGIAITKLLLTYGFPHITMCDKVGIVKAENGKVKATRFPQSQISTASVKIET